MSDTPTWAPPAKVEDLFAKTAGHIYAAVNSPVAGARTQADLPAGSAPIQLYSLATPNGHKVSILLEELGVDYDAHGKPLLLMKYIPSNSQHFPLFTVINILKGDQFTSGFVSVNPNSKIPALVDKEGPDGQPMNLFESASISLYLAEKYQRFLPTNPRHRAEMMNWIFWQMGGLGPFSGQFGHFFVYAPADKCETRDYGVSRYGMETQRLCSVLDQYLADKEYLVNNEYSLADITVFPWFYGLMSGFKHSSGVAARDFLSIDQYKNAVAWAERIAARPAVKRGLTVCGINGIAKPWLSEEKK